MSSHEEMVQTSQTMVRTWVANSLELCLSPELHQLKIKKNHVVLLFYVKCVQQKILFVMVLWAFELIELVSLT